MAWWQIALAVAIGAGLVLLLTYILIRSALSPGQIEKELVRFSERIGQIFEGLSQIEQRIREETRANRQELGQVLKNLLDSSSKQVMDLTRLNEEKLENIRRVVDENLKAIQQENAQRLEEMRKTVDEKLQTTLEKRLTESFSQVSERLESVYKGLGEMQKLASEVGNLKNVLTNVRVMGVLGEVQLERLIDEVLTPEQYQKQASINGNKVDFAIKLPGRDDEVVLLPIDSKFPLGEYERLLSAYEQADKELIAESGKTLESAVKLQAQEIKKKYISPPLTTDFAIMFLPIEGLYAEVLRRPGLFESLQTQYKVTITGPTTLLAFLNSLQMGFKTLAIEQKASEVWKLLSAIKTDLNKFMENLRLASKHLQDASSQIEKATHRTKQIGRKLKEVEELPVSEAEKILPPSELEEIEED